VAAAPPVNDLGRPAVSMKKIKKFRLHPRPSSVLRGLKALRPDISPDLDKSIEAELLRAPALLSTAAVYDTFRQDRSPAWAAGLWETENETGAKPIAVTFYAATVGDALEKEAARVMDAGDGLRGQILTSIGEEAADQSANFVHRLVADEAKEDSCELSPRADAADAGLSDILSLLEADKVSIRLSEDGRLLPRFSRAGHILWWPPAKKRK